MHSAGIPAVQRTDVRSLLFERVLVHTNAHNASYHSRTPAITAVSLNPRCPWMLWVRFYSVQNGENGIQERKGERSVNTFLGCASLSSTLGRSRCKGCRNGRWAFTAANRSRKPKPLTDHESEVVDEGVPIAWKTCFQLV